MANYQQFHRFKQKPEQAGFRLGRILAIFAIVVVLYLIGRAVFSGGDVDTTLVDESGVEIIESQSEETAGANSNENSNANTNSDTDTNSNSNTNTDTNTNVSTVAAGGFDLGACTKVYSRGSTDEKQVSLTFNVGTSKEGEIQKVLSVLSDTGTSADFFARGDVAENNPDLINKINDAGFPIYNLSYNHPRFNDLPTSGMTEQLAKADAAISQRTGKSTKPFFRPPYGEADEDVVTTAAEAGYCTVSWTVDALDWSAEYTAAQSKERVLSSITSGGIVLMQAANATTAEILPEVISQLKSQGYAIVGLTTLIGS